MRELRARRGTKRNGYDRREEEQGEAEVGGWVGRVWLSGQPWRRPLCREFNVKTSGTSGTAVAGAATFVDHKWKVGAAPITMAAASCGAGGSVQHECMVYHMLLVMRLLVQKVHHAKVSGTAR